MSKLHECIDPKLAGWIAAQKIFFVGTAPLSGEGHVNISPKGGDAFRILGPKEVAYQDYTGSGAETAAHVQENGRIVIMFCAFEGGPQIVRLHGQGELITAQHSEYQRLLAGFSPNAGTRAIIRVTIDRVSDSCGFSVPFYEFRGKRDTLDRWAEKQGQEKLDEYRANKNVTSIDALPAFRP